MNTRERSLLHEQSRREALVLDAYPDQGGGWWNRAACRGTNTPDLFHPASTTPGQVRLARDVYCNRCPVFAECLADAIATDADGIWAGTSKRSRDLMVAKAAVNA